MDTTESVETNTNGPEGSPVIRETTPHIPSRRPVRKSNTINIAEEQNNEEQPTVPARRPVRRSTTDVIDDLVENTNEELLEMEKLISRAHHHRHAAQDLNTVKDDTQEEDQYLNSSNDKSEKSDYPLSPVNVAASNATNSTTEEIPNISDRPAKSEVTETPNIPQRPEKAKTPDTAESPVAPVRPIISQSSVSSDSIVRLQSPSVPDRSERSNTPHGMTAPSDTSETVSSSLADKDTHIINVSTTETAVPNIPQRPNGMKEKTTSIESIPQIPKNRPSRKSTQEFPSNEHSSRENTPLSESDTKNEANRTKESVSNVGPMNFENANSQLPSIPKRPISDDKKKHVEQLPEPVSIDMDIKKQSKSDEEAKNIDIPKIHTEKIISLGVHPDMSSEKDEISLTDGNKSSINETSIETQVSEPRIIEAVDKSTVSTESSELQERQRLDHDSDDFYEVSSEQEDKFNKKRIDQQTQNNEDIQNIDDEVVESSEIKRDKEEKHHATSIKDASPPLLKEAELVQTENKNIGPTNTEAQVKEAKEISPAKEVSPVREVSPHIPTSRPKKKAAPPVPKKPASRIAALHEMLKQQQMKDLSARGVPAESPIPTQASGTTKNELETTKDPSDTTNEVANQPSRVNVANNLNTLFALPGMVPPGVNPAVLSKILPNSQPSNNNSTADNNNTDKSSGLSDVRQKRARGPRGRKLPTKVNNVTKVVDEGSKNSIEIFNTWSVDFTLKRSDEVQMENSLEMYPKETTNSISDESEQIVPNEIAESNIAEEVNGRIPSDEVTESAISKTIPEHNVETQQIEMPTVDAHREGPQAQGPGEVPCESNTPRTESSKASLSDSILARDDDGTIMSMERTLEEQAEKEMREQFLETDQLFINSQSGSLGISNRNANDVTNADECEREEFTEASSRMPTADE